MEFDERMAKYMILGGYSVLGSAPLFYESFWVTGQDGSVQWPGTRDEWL